MQVKQQKSGWAISRRATAMIGVVGLALTMAACSSSPEPIPTPTVTVTPTIDSDKSAVPDPNMPTTWPLTGIEGGKGGDKLVNRPAMSVKIENTSAARPQSGLENADVVWETIVEFDVSRFIAVYHSDLPDAIGPIRSARPMDVQVISPLDGLFVFSGAQGGINKLIAKTPGIQAMSQDAGSRGLYRLGTRSAPHNVYGTLKEIVGLANSKHSSSPEPQFVFARDAKTASTTLDGKKTSGIALRMSAASSPSWTWSAKSETWLRAEGSTPAMSAAGKQLAATNVVVIVVESFNSPFKAQGGAPVPDLRLKGKGKAVVASGGKSIEVKWSKKNIGSPLELTDKAGKPVELAPGNTWVELLPKATGTYTLK